MRPSARGVPPVKKQTEPKFYDRCIALKAPQTAPQKRETPLIYLGRFANTRFHQAAARRNSSR